MVNTRGKKKTGSNRTPDANMEPIGLYLSEGQTSHSLRINMEKPNVDGQYVDKVEIPVEKAENEGFKKTPVEEESERGTKVDNNDENVTEINNDNKAESEQNTSEDEEADQEDLKWDEEKEKLSEDNVETFADEDEASEEEAEKNDDNDEASIEEASGEDDDGVEVSRQKTAEVAKGDESNAKAKVDEKDAKAKKVGMETKDHSSEKMEAGLKNDKNSNERNGKKVQVGSSKKVDTKDHPESSRKRKGKKRVESMGMIFMCSSKTKNDCYQYRVLGLPESKKDIVEKIYTGMRLFLYDVDLKLMYGIYKAVGPGGYNIEPKAFKSQFPAQVRFAVLDDCLPIPEEKFKKVIKENYFTNTKFDCQLKAEQVKKLCKLFIALSKGSRSKKLRRSHKAETPRLPVRPERLKKRRVGGDERRLVPVEEHRYPERPRKRPRKAVISPLHHQPLPVLLPSTVPPYVYKMPSDGDAYNRRGQYPYRQRYDPPIVNHRDPYRDGYPERDYPYIDGRDPHIKRHDSYKDGRDIYLRGCDPYVDGRASYLERHDAYRDGRDLDAGIRSSYGDGQDSYLEHRDPYTYSEAYGSYKRDPVSNGLDAYREDRGEYGDSFRRVEELRHPYVFEAGNRHDNGSRDSYVSNRQRLSYAGPIYSAEYPSRAGLAREYHL